MFQATTHATLTDGDRAFLQHRLSRFGLTSTVVFGGFMVFLATTALYNGTPGELTRPAMLGMAAATFSFLALWLVNARGERTVRVIRGLETAALLIAALAFNFSAADIAHVGRPDYILLLTLFSALVGRAIYVPSSPRRSFLLAALIGIETLGMIYVKYLSIDVATWLPVLMELPHWQSIAEAGELTPARLARSMTVNASVWWCVITFTTTAASHVIYGLRREARDAKKLGQYHLGRKLGEGGMGIVYMAHHALLRRPTAVKLLLPEKAGERAIERFEREVRLMARLRHPNTVTVFDYGRSPDGIFYYAMEHIDGATLGEVVELTGPFDAGRAVAVVAGAAAAMVEAHGIGLIHRDIKPANLMLYLPHAHGIMESVKVLDFGLVKDVSSGDAGLTRAGSITGTPQYMAPEAILDPEAVDGRSDVYALGCVLFYLLTGEHLFDGASVMEVCAKHLHEQPGRMSDRLGEPVDEQLEEVVAACVAKAPSERLGSARELLDRLHAISGLVPFTERDAGEWWDEYGHVFEHEFATADQKLTIDIGRARSTPSG